MHSIYSSRYPFQRFFELLSAISLHFSCLILMDFCARLIIGSANLKEFKVTSLQSVQIPSINFPNFFSFRQLKQLTSYSFSILNLLLSPVSPQPQVPTLLSINLSALSEGSTKKRLICLLISPQTLANQSEVWHQVRILCSYCMYRIGAWTLWTFYQYCSLQQQQALQVKPATTGNRRSFRMGSFLFGCIFLSCLRFTELRFYYILGLF